MELRDLGGALWRQRPLVLLVLLVVALGCAAGLALAPRSYAATASRAAPATPVVPDGDRARAGIAADAASPAVLAAAVERAGVDRDADDLRDHVTAAVVPETTRVSVTVTDRDPRVAAALADAVVAELVGRTNELFTWRDAEPAVVPRSPTSPDVSLVVGLGAVVAIIAAAGGAVRRDARSRTVRDGAAVEAATSAPLLAHLVAPHDPEELPATAGGTVAAARFARLLGALEALSPRRRVERVVVAGVGAGEVPAWIAANLAVTLGRAGHRVLLVDARLGHLGPAPGPAPAVDDEPVGPGLAGVLGGLALADAVGPGPVRGVTLLPAGDRGTELSRAWLADEFGQVMEQAREQADVVVVTAPSLTDADDARVMSAGGMLLMVVPEGRLTSIELRAHADRVRAAGGRLAGVVLVAPPEPRGRER